MSINISAVIKLLNNELQVPDGSLPALSLTSYLARQVNKHNEQNNSPIEDLPYLIPDEFADKMRYVLNNYTDELGELCYSTKTELECLLAEMCSIRYALFAELDNELKTRVIDRARQLLIEFNSEIKQLGDAIWAERDKCITSWEETSRA